MLDARFSQLYFVPSLNTLQRVLPAIAGLLVCTALKSLTNYSAAMKSIIRKILYTCTLYERISCITRWFCAI